MFGVVAFGDPATSTRRATGTAAALSRLLFRLAFGRGAGEDAAGAQQRAGGLPAANVRHQRGTSAGNRGRNTVGPGVGTRAARPPLSPGGNGGEGALPPMPTAQMPGERKARAMGLGVKAHPSPGEDPPSPPTGIFPLLASLPPAQTCTPDFGTRMYLGHIWPFPAHPPAFTLASLSSAAAFPRFQLFIITFVPSWPLGTPVTQPPLLEA